MTHRLDLEWEKWGQRDPYFGVLSADRFRSDRLDAGARAEFFASGERHVDGCFGIMRGHVSAAFAPARALDFGCGVGRVAIPLARRCAEVVGVDVSSTMLAEARRNRDQLSAGNLLLVQSDDTLSAVPGTFDFVHSFIVFQHIPAARGERLLRAMLQRLEPGGYAALHFAVAGGGPRLRRWLHRLSWGLPAAGRLVNALRGRSADEPIMLIDYYDAGRVLAILREHGCDHLYLRGTDHGGVLGMMVFAERRRFESL